MKDGNHAWLLVILCCKKAICFFHVSDTSRLSPVWSLQGSAWIQDKSEGVPTYLRG